MQASAGQQPGGILFHVIGYELIHAAGETDDLGSHIVDEHRAVNAARVQKFEKSLRGAAEFDNLIEVRALLLHQIQRIGLEHFDGLDMDVAVSDHAISISSPSKCSSPMR